MKLNLFAVMTIPLLVGCAAIQVAVSKKNLDVQNKMSASVFLDPAESNDEKSVYLEVHNTSDKKEFDIQSEISARLVSKGYRLVPQQKSAHYVVQANVLQVGKSSPNAAEAAMYKGYGYDGAVIGGSVAYMAGASSETMVGAGLLGGLGSIIADSVVKDVYYSVIVDIQIKERLKPGQKSELTVSHYNLSGTSGGTTAFHNEKSDWKIYQTRILSSANKVNLDFAEALPALKEGISQSVVGIF